MKRCWTTGDTSCCATVVMILVLSVGRGNGGINGLADIGGGSFGRFISGRVARQLVPQLVLSRYTGRCFSWLVIEVGLYVFPPPAEAPQEQ